MPTQTANPYRSVAELLAAELTLEESPETLALIESVSGARRRGYLTQREFLELCRWKSPRAIARCKANSRGRVRRCSATAFASRSERVRFDALTSLDGVGGPTASAILTLTDPRRYGVIDIRVWRLLYDLGSVRMNPTGVGFSFEHWRHYLETLRRHALELGVTVRAVEYSLFLYHQWTRQGRLYDPRPD
jgi:hypothetical protein